MLGDIVNWITSTLTAILHWFQTLTPGGFGLILLPLIALGLISLWVSRRA
jgi:hypothetical protein